MTVRWRDADVERLLRDVAAEVDFPPAPALVTLVADRLRAEARPAPAVRRASVAVPARARVWVAAVLALVLLASAALALSPGARHAVARWLGLGGERIQTVGTLPPVPTRTTPSAPADAFPVDPLLGERMRLPEARARVGFPIRLPAALGAPDRVFVDDRLPGGRLTLAYLPRPGLPASPETGYGLLVSEFVGSLERESLLKLIPQGTAVESVTVNGHEGYWIEAASHELVYLGPDGNARPDTLRLAGPTLVWTQHGVTVRIEGNVTKSQALALAATIR